MIELFIGCSLLLTNGITEQSIDDYFLCNHLQDVKQWYGLTQQYFGDETLKALAIMSCESDGKITALNVNSDGSKDKGLFQFNSKTEKWLENNIYNKELDMYNPKTNIKAAAWVVNNIGNWSWWNSSKHCWERYDTFSK